MTSKTLLPVLGAIVLAGCASVSSLLGPPAPAKVADGAFVGGNGMTLYTFDRDPRWCGQERVQRALRHQLAAAAGRGRRRQGGR